MPPARPGEFELIARLTERIKGPLPPGTVGIGDDCAAVPQGEGYLLLTCDSAVAGRHFLPGLTPMADVGWRIATANVSDVCACGGLPTQALISLALPPEQSLTELDALYDGLAEAAAAYGFQVVGGNVTGADTLMVDIFMLGLAPRFIPRSGARPGEYVVVSGPLGDSAAGLEALREGSDSPEALALRARHLRPRARTDLVPLLQDVAGAAIDISDGLAAELHHMARQSAVRLAIQGDEVPRSPELEAHARGRGEEPLVRALSSGEEYALLFTMAPAHLDRLEGTGARVIGEVQEGEGVLLDGQPLPPAGWDHLRSPRE